MKYIDVKRFVDVPKRIGDVTGEPTGFPNTTDSTISFDDGTRTFTIEPAVTSFEFYSLGKRYKKTSADTVVIDDTEGIWFIYYGTDGVLTASQTPWTFFSGQVFVALVYWDATNNLGIGIGEERHGLVMDAADHKYKHNNFGALWQSGHTPALTVDGDGSLDAHCEIQSISAGLMCDEDIEHSSAEQTSYEMWYKDGATSAWRKEAVSAAAVAITTDRPDYNEDLGGGDWTRTEVANNRFTLTHIFATNSVEAGKNILVMGENQYLTKAAARDGAATELANLTTAGLPTVEFTPIATIIIEVKDAYTNSYNARTISTDDGFDFVDWRESEKTGVGASPTHHGNLTGLTDDDHTQYLLADGSRAVAGNLLPDADSTRDLGSSGPLYWANAFIDYLWLTSTQVMQGGNHEVKFGKNIADGFSDRIGIGVDSGNNPYIFGQTGATSIVNFKSPIKPFTSAAYDLGTASNLWKDLYLSGDLKDGSNSVSVAEAKTAYDEAIVKTVGLIIFQSDTAVETGDGLSGIPIDSSLNGYEIVDVIAIVHDKGVTNTTDIQLRRRRAGSDVDVLSTKITIGDEWFANDGVINTSNDDLATGDLLYPDVDAIHSGTAPNGLSVAVKCQKPA